MSKQRRNRHCKIKTAKGNVYNTEEMAIDRAHAMSVKLNKEIVAYGCEICGKFHVGGMQTIRKTEGW